MTEVGTATELVSARLAAHRDPEAAVAMAAYMKTEMPFYGVKAAVRRQIAKDVIARFPAASAADVWGVASPLWELPHREEKYVAVGYLRQYARFLDATDLPAVARLVETGAWWDLVDEIASHVVGPIVRSDPEQAWPIVEAWNEASDLWLRRTSIICQLTSGERTDQDRLFGFCLARAGDPEFFIRKAIGWALRQYARTAPDAVTRFLDDHHTELSNLSIREASKHLPRSPQRQSGTIGARQ